MVIHPVEQTAMLKIETSFPMIGNLSLWLPEGILSDTGASSVYPIGTEWERSGPHLKQRITREHLFGPGNCPRIDPGTLVCCDIRFPVDSPVEWITAVAQDEHTVDFTIRLTNVGRQRIKKAGSAICLHFLDADWWRDSNTFVVSGGVLKSLAELGRAAGPDNGFQAYLVQHQSYNHIFYQQFWGFNPNRVDRALIISEHTKADLCVGIETASAYFVHSNRGNPCTDLMLAFGDLGPNDAAEAHGSIWIRPGSAEELW